MYIKYFDLTPGEEMPQKFDREELVALTLEAIFQDGELDDYLRQVHCDCALDRDHDCEPVRIVDVRALSGHGLVLKLSDGARFQMQITPYRPRKMRPTPTRGRGLAATPGRLDADGAPARALPSVSGDRDRSLPEAGSSADGDAGTVERVQVTARSDGGGVTVEDQDRLCDVDPTAPAG